jgi:hypothetical protein
VTDPRIQPLPSMSRLAKVWDGVEQSTTRLEHATHVFLTMWTLHLADLDYGNIDGWQGGNQSAHIDELERTLKCVVDDEVTWHLGNRSQTVELVDDTVEGLVTVGELIGRITMLAVLLDKWPRQRGDCPLAPAFATFGQQYDALAQGLVAGNCRQPRRRSQGGPPIREPQRVDLGWAPRPDGAASRSRRTAGSTGQAQGEPR